MAIDKEQIFLVADELDAEGIKPTLANVRKRLGSGSYTTISELMNEWHKERRDSESPVNKEPTPSKISDKLEEFGVELWNMAVEIASARLQSEKEEMLSIQSALELKQKETADIADQMAAEIEILRQDKAELESVLKVSKENESTLQMSLQDEIMKTTGLANRLNSSEELTSYLQTSSDKLQLVLNESTEENRKLLSELARQQVLNERSESELKQLKDNNEELTKQLLVANIENGKLMGTMEALQAQVAEKNEKIQSLEKPKRGRTSNAEPKE
ncbi:DNA-binding protein [Paenibacillus sp. FSL H8-0317]|uniref:DNA-binding protein n=1 Tax=Paenibacillus sp. FSL H8-0317 TaxID=2921385 RepID=UPI0032511DE8